ncbi:MAG: hypothetical protein P9X24_11240 [Candidatus Hatepunaea meridiana]|nr:hypothetical protein [Candidatus Hatepunaea meridiana]
MKITEPPICSHCSELMKKMEMPNEAAYDSPFMYVCFNDDCPYYVKGWEWMLEKYNVKTSYRHRINPSTGFESPLPVWSKDAMRDRIIK